MALGLVLLMALPATAPTWVVLLLLIPVGCGGSLSAPSVTALLLDHTPAERAGTAGGMLNTSRQVGGALAVAVFGGLIANRAHFMAGLHTSLLICVAALVVTAWASVALRPAHR